MSGIKIIAQEDITQAVAPSIDLEQELFNFFGHAVRMVDGELKKNKPWLRWFLTRMLGLVLNERRRYRLGQRLFKRTAQALTLLNIISILFIFSN